MAKPKGVNQKAQWQAHSIRLAKYADRVQSVYDTLNKEVAELVHKTGYDGSEPFKWSDFPATKKKFEEVRTQFVKEMRAVIYSGTSEEWKQSNLVQDLLADNVLKFYGIKKNGKKAKVYYQTNNDALKAFQQRKDDGLNLSQKLWNQSADYQTEMEYCLSSAIEKGMSAVKLSKKLSKYLVDYPSLKKDYKEKFGKAVTCGDCEYRSIRLARSEINMAYRTAEQERWKQFDFVLGYEVKLTRNGRHVSDICDDLAGKYPKDFKFVGWHPNCMCYVIPVLKSEEQFFNYEDVSEISEPPQGFSDWLKDNAERIDQARRRDTLPYWYTDNPRYVTPSHKKTIQEIAEERHAKRDDEKILNALQIRRDLDDFDKEELSRIRKWCNSLGLDKSEMENSFWVKTNDVEDVRKQIYIMSDKVDEVLDNWHQRILDKTAKLRSEAHRYSLSSVEKEITEWSVKNKPKPNVSLSDTMSSLQIFEQKIAAKINSLKAKSVIRPKNIADAFVDLGSYMDYDQKVDNILKNVGQLLGTAPVEERHSELKTLAHILKPFGSGGSLYGQAASNSLADKQIQQYLYLMNRGTREVMQSINHLRELNEASDLDKIPLEWRKKFNKYVKVIEAHDVATKGYYGIYREIEGAYNIYKLSTSQDAVAYGLRRLSVNTPHQIFTEFKRYGIDLTHFETKIVNGTGAVKTKFVDTMPRKDFFDSFEKFIPFSTSGDVSVQAHFDSINHHVVFNFHNEIFVQRYKQSAYFSEGLFYHEFGHAKDYLYGMWQAQPKWKDFFAKYQKIADAHLNGCDIYQFRTTKKCITIKKELKNSGKYSDGDIEEIIGNMEDTIQALLSDHRHVGIFGHSENYFKYNAGLCVTELIAHCSEAFWLGNEFMERYSPSFYKDVLSIMKKYK